MKKAIAVLLICSGLFFMVKTNSYAVDIYPSPSAYDTCVEHYFAKIEDDVSKNLKGSCACVALSLMLNFYDFYWSDLFVADSFVEHDTLKCYSTSNYPSKIPKLKVENEVIPKNDDGSDNKDEYARFVENKSNDYLHLYLISLAAKNVTDNDGNYLIDLQQESYGIDIDETKQLLEYYLNSVGVTNEKVEVHVEKMQGEINSESELYETIKNAVQSGIPVFYGADNASGDGHAMVAFSYKENDIQLHSGHVTDSYTTVLSTEYRMDASILWIEFKNGFSHMCNNKFTWYPEEVSVCSCIAYKDMHPAHVHEDSGDLLRRDATTHTYECIWGDEITEPHDLYYENVSSGYHRLACDCGYKDEQLEMHHMLRKNVNYSICTDCAHIIYHNNGIIEVPGIESTDDSKIQ